jgi:hypothetical protein
MNQESQQHRITPEQISMCAYPGDGVASPEKVVAEINKLYAHVEALKASLLSLVSTVAKAGNDHKSRIEALELAQRVTDSYIVTAATFSSEERKELGVITLPEFKAAMARAARQGAERAKAQIQTGTMDELQAALVGLRDRAPGSLKSTIYARFELDPKHDASATASAEARPAGLAEQLAALITSATTSRGAAQDVLRKVAAWLKEQERRGLVDLPEALEQEAME